ncbi:MAG: DUF4465 domain-containing protein [Taibaiella sp.]|nr:DUF4465 domain-containing protein [Taibaiella sp.]
MKTNFTKSLALGLLCIPMSQLALAQSESISFDDVSIPEAAASISKSVEIIPDEMVDYSFESGGVTFRGSQAYWGNFSGFDCSRGTDSLDGSYANDISVIAAIGYEESENYAVAYVQQRFPDAVQHTHPIGIRLNTDSTQELVGTYFTNTTLTYRYILDNLANITSYQVIVKGYTEGEMVSDSVVFDLASISDTDTMLVRDWTFVSFEALGAVDSITFEAFSDDITTYTPFYFAFDEIIIKDIPPTSVETAVRNSLKVLLSPNPASHYLDIKAEDARDLQFKIYNIQGQLMQYGQLHQGRISLHHLSAGNYFIHLEDVGTRKEAMLKFVKL